jgi:hypothetical protein
LPVKTGIPWRVFIMADTRSVNRYGIAGFADSPPPWTGLPVLLDRFCSTPEPPLALKALRAMGAAMSLSFVAEHGR